MRKKRNAIRADGRIAVQVYIGRGEDGKRKYKTAYGKTQAEAEAAADALRKKYKRNCIRFSPDSPFSVFADAFWETANTGENTSYMVGLQGRIEWWKDHVGAYPISDISLSMLQEPLNDLAKRNPRTKKQTSKKTIGDYIGVVNQIFTIAVKNQVINFNPAEYLDMPSAAKDKQERRALNDDEQQWIIDTPHDMQPAAMIIMYGGLRRGEVIPLLVKDVDLENKLITVDKSVKMVNGVPVLKRGAKTDAGTRTAGIPDILVDYLRVYLAGKSPLEYVFPGKGGKMVTESAWRRMWDSYLVDLNLKYGNSIDRKGNLAKSKFNPNGIDITIPHITSHWLRHTYATILYLSGVDKLEAAEMMGHEDVKMILEVYAHLDRLYKQRSVSKVDAYLSGKKICKSNASHVS